MRIVVLSDTHRDFHSLRRLVEKHLADTQLFIHLGDGLPDLELAQSLYPQCQFLAARGNCDFASARPLAGLYTTHSARIFYTHGHLYNVKQDLHSLLQAAGELHANVVLFGHTHQALYQYRRGVHLLNPGSLGMPQGARTYGVVDVTSRGIVCFLSRL